MFEYTCRNLGSFAELRQVTISFVTSVCPSVPMEQLGSQLTDFLWIWYSYTFRKVGKESSRYNGCYVKTNIQLREDQHTSSIITRPFLLRKGNVSGENCREYQNTHFRFSKVFLRKSYRLWDNVEKYCTAGQASDDDMVHAHCILDT
jgi:hypothetical protein